MRFANGPARILVLFLAGIGHSSPGDCRRLHDYSKRHPRGQGTVGPGDAMTPGPAFSATRLLNALALCVALLAAGELAAAPLKVVGRFLQDTHGNNILMRGVNLPVYKSGWADDLDAVAAAIALTKTNVVRLEWWAVPPAGTTEYTLANLDRAIQKFHDLGIIPVVELHDLTFQYGHDTKVGLDSDGNDRAIFANTITAFWTRADVLAILVRHQDHLVINLANEWGSSFYSDGTPTTANFIQNYTDAITAMRNAGIIAPLMVDAPKGFEYQFLLDHGQALLDAVDPQHKTMLSIHTYWAASAFTDAGVNTILDAFMNRGLPVVLGEASSNAWTNIQCDPIHYANLLTRANTNAIGYLFWAWYEDGQCGQDMNITVGAYGVTLPTNANPGFGYDALYHPGFGIDAAQPPTRKADFSPVTPPLQPDCLFTWAERTYATLFAPAGAVSQTLAPYNYRHYSQTDAYLGTSSANNHVYYLGPASSYSLYDVGELSSWLTTAGCQ